MGQVDAEAIIAEEGLSETPVTDDVEETKDGTESEDSGDDNKGDDSAKVEDESKEEHEKPKPGDVIKPEEEKDGEQPAEKQEDKREEPAKPETDTNSASKQVEEAKSFMAELNEKGYEVYDKDGKVRDFEKVVPPGKYLAAQLNPVKVTDKDGKTHEFLLISDLEKAFPDGFDAKNNVEQMKLERGLMSNENKFEQAVGKYNELKSTYEQEVGQVASIQERNQSIAGEYNAMAEAGIVPKAEGDLKDPNNPAVKELDSILAWMDKTNAENQKKGLGQITSIWVAKQLMGQESPKTEPNEDKKKEITEERKKVASLTATTTPSKSGESTGQRRYSSNPHQLASQIIEEEGLK